MISRGADRPADWRRWVLPAMVAAGVVVRALCFVGLASGDPQDDGVYYGNAYTLYHEGPSYLARYRNLPPGFLANPIDQFNVRPMVTYPIVASFALFGPGELAAALWPLVCSALTIGVVYRIGRVVHGPRVGMIAALLCTFYPLEVINGTRILSDAIVGLFSSIAIWLLIEGMARSSLRHAFLAGVSSGAAYLANARGLILLAALAVTVAIVPPTRRRDPKAIVALLAGFAAILAVEGAVYLATTGDPLLSIHIQRSAAEYKYLHEPVTTIDWGRLHVRYTNGTPFELTRAAFRLDRDAVNQYGWFFFLFLPAVVFGVADRSTTRLAMLAIGLFIYLEFGPVAVHVNWPAGTVDYLMVFKQQRFLTMLTGPLLVVSATLIERLARRTRVVAVVLVAALCVTSGAAILQARGFYRAGLSDLRSLADDVATHPDRVYFSDTWAVWHLRIFTRYRTRNLRVLAATDRLQALDGGCLIVGGGRGVELVSDYVESTLPPFARQILVSGQPPSGLTLVRSVGGPRTPWRRHDLSVYCPP